MIVNVCASSRSSRDMYYVLNYYVPEEPPKSPEKPAAPRPSKPVKQTKSKSAKSAWIEKLKAKLFSNKAK